MPQVLARREEAAEVAALLSLPSPSSAAAAAPGAAPAEYSASYGSDALLASEPQGW